MTVNGYPLVHTACRLRRHAINTYHEAGLGVYPDDRKHGVDVVRCSVTTEL